LNEELSLEKEDRSLTDFKEEGDINDYIFIVTWQTYQPTKVFWSMIDTLESRWRC